MIGFKTKAFVSFDRVESGVLQFVSLQLCQQADPAALLLFIKEHTCALVGDHGQGHLELLSAVTPQRAKHVPRQALRVNTHQRRSGADVSRDQGNCLFLPLILPDAKNAFETVNAELSPAGREVRGRDLPDRARKGHNIIIDGEVRGSRCVELRGAVFRSVTSSERAPWSKCGNAARIESNPAIQFWSGAV